METKMLDFGLGNRNEVMDTSGEIGNDARSPSKRPRIGLALGGGAARGWAHIGVVKTLKAAGYDAEIVGGTSMGAVVGGCYVTDTIPQLEKFATNLNKRRLFGLMDLNFSGAGLINGNKLGQLLHDNIGEITIDDLEKKYIAIATELSTGHEIWLGKGNLVQAMRASYAMPGVFKPFKIHGRWLVDGALVNPVPVSVCRAYGARLVIAVNLNTDFLCRGTVVRSHDLFDAGNDDDCAPEDIPEVSNGRAAKRLLRRQLVGPEKGPPGISRVMFDSYNIVQDRIARSRLAGDPPDIMIGPRLSHIGLFDFHRAQEAIEIGAEAAEKALDEIGFAVKALSVRETSEENMTRT